MILTLENELIMKGMGTHTYVKYVLVGSSNETNTRKRPIGFQVFLLPHKTASATLLDDH